MPDLMEVTSTPEEYVGNETSSVTVEAAPPRQEVSHSPAGLLGHSRMPRFPTPHSCSQDNNQDASSCQAVQGSALSRQPAET